MSRADFTFEWNLPTSSSINYSGIFNDSTLWWQRGKHVGEAAQAKTWVLLLAGFLALVSLLGNALVMAAFLGWSKLRTGQNVMLVNVSISDVFFVFFALPPTLISNLGFNMADTSNQKQTFFSTGGLICRIVHYILSICLYVAIYSPVAACVFRFFSELMKRGLRFGRRNGSNRNRLASVASRSLSYSSDSTGANVLTTSNAAISCAVIWLAFFLANVNVLHGDSYDSNAAAVVGLHQPSVCNNFYVAATQRQQQQHEQQSMSLQSLVYRQHMGQQQQQQQQKQQQRVSNLPADPATKMRTLWLIFLISAFLIPLAVISILSGILLFWIQCRQLPNRDPITSVIAAQESSLITTRMTSSLTSSPVSYSSYATTSSAVADYADSTALKRDAVVLIMAVSVARSLCWLPVQICLLVDVFGLSRDERISTLHQKAEIFGVCFALIGCTINPIIFYCSMLDFRRAITKISRRLCQREKKRALTLERLSAARNHSRNSYHKPTNIDYNYISHGGDGPTTSGAGSGAGRPGTIRRKESDANETILSIISDSSNRINYS